MSTTKENADIYIYGDITSYEWLDSDVSSYSLAMAIDGIDVPQINVYINSYGGEVAEGLAIHNALRRHKAKVTTYCDGFACSAASVVFMAGDTRVMYPSSLLMIHNAWTIAMGDSDDLHKAADDLKIISDTTANAYKEHVNISDEELMELLDNETWLIPEEALEKGFATAILSVPISEKVSQNVRTAIFNKVLSDSTSKGVLFLDEKEADTLCRLISSAMTNDLQTPLETDESGEDSTVEESKPTKKYFNFRKESKK